MKKTTKFIIAVIALISIFACAKKNVSSDYSYIKSKGKMTIGMTLFAPMNYYDKNGEFVGFDTEFAKEACKKLGLTAEFVEINWDLKETELVSKNIDCIWNGMTITEQLQKNLSITDPYMANRQVLVTQSEDAAKIAKKLEGIHVATEQGSAGERIAMFLQDITYTPVDSQMKALMEVKSGLANAAIVDYILSFGAFGEGTDFSDFVIVDRRIADSELYGIAFRKGSDMTEKLNQIINEMRRDGSIRAIAEKYKLEPMLID